jgi:fructose-bisphosphate aldolase class I
VNQVIEKQDRVVHGKGFFAALDQSGGSTPAALRLYGIDEEKYATGAEMFDLMHTMRERIMTAPAFNGDRIIAAILFENTMRGLCNGVPVPDFLWDRGIVSFLKVDQGLEPERDGVRLMAHIPELLPRLEEASRLGVFGTKMRSTIGGPSATGIEAIVGQQFETALLIAYQGLMPIVEPEVLKDSEEKEAVEDLLRIHLLRALNRLPQGVKVILKLTPPTMPDLYRELAAHGGVARLLALSGGYSREAACQKLRANHSMIASFSRALTEGLHVSMNQQEFEAALAASIDQIFRASTAKSGKSA